MTEVDRSDCSSSEMEEIHMEDTEIQEFQSLPHRKTVSQKAPFQNGYVGHPITTEEHSEVRDELLYGSQSIKLFDDPLKCLRLDDQGYYSPMLIEQNDVGGLPANLDYMLAMDTFRR